MNIHQLRCAVTVARLGSQTRAAEALYMSQPNLSKALKELEQSCGIRIFTRTGNGMTPTRRGEEFLARARAVLEQMDAMDAIYQGRSRAGASLSVAVPRAGYIGCALTAFVNAADVREGMELNIRETNTQQAVDDVLSREADIGIVRYSLEMQNKTLGSLNEQGLHYILYWSFKHVALMSRNHPLARQKRLAKGQLLPYVEILHGDELPPVGLYTSAPEAIAEPRRKIRVYERGTQLDLLSRCPNTYMWTSPAPRELLERHGLVQLPSDEAEQPWQDALIYLKGYTMSRDEQAFYDALRREIEKMGQ